MVDSGFQVEFDDSEKMFNQIDGKATKQPDNTVVVQIHRGIDKLAILIKINEKNFDL